MKLPKFTFSRILILLLTYFFAMCVFGVIFCFARNVHAGVVFDDHTGTTQPTNKPMFYKTKDTVKEIETTSVKTAGDGLALRKLRRVAVGAQAGGSLGMGGALIELNFTPDFAFNGGYGGGEGFQSFLLQAKHVLAGDWIMPYLAFGYANWSSTGQSTRIEKTRPGLLAGRLLSDDEKAEGQFRKHLLIPSFGLQFMQLDGEYAGFSIFLEGNVIFDIGGFVAAPTGAMGLMYFF